MIRRMMLVNNSNNPDNPGTEDETNYIIATYDCSVKTNVRVLGDLFDASQVKYMYMDNKKNKVKVNQWKTWNFKKKGNHTIKYIMQPIVKNCENLFNMCEELRTFDFSHFNMYVVETLKNAFYKTGVTSGTMKNFEWLSLTTMEGMFAQCLGFKRLEFVNCKTPVLTSIKDLCNYSNIEYADLSGIDTSNITDMSGMFKDDWYLKTLKVMTPVDKVTTTAGAYRGIARATFYYNKNYNYKNMNIPWLWKEVAV